MKKLPPFIYLLLLATVNSTYASPKPIASNRLVFEEINGLVAVEAEHFFEQDKSSARAWYITHPKFTPDVRPDADPNHAADASGGAYVEALPDTRKNHGEKLIVGENFSNEAGRMAILSYKVYFNTPGKYYVWARTHSTGTEDNGIHVGLNGEWPASGQRMQWTAKNQWFWDSKQRTEKVHTGVPHLLFLEIPKPGLHTIQFSMREDGFEFDKWLMTNDRDFKRPADAGPAPAVKMGKMPATFLTKTKSKLKAGLDGDGSIAISGQLKQWHKVTVTCNGPFADEANTSPNPFLDYRMTASFFRKTTKEIFHVPGYFAANGVAGQSAATSGTIWRAHFTPPGKGEWMCRVIIEKGKHAAVNDKGERQKVFTPKPVAFTIEPSNKTGRDFRSKGRLTYVGKHHLQFAGSKEYFLKAGADAPETLLAYTDFDGTVQTSPKGPLKSWKAHVKDWQPGDPTWKDGKGKGLIGALNYLSSTGANAFSFLTYNAGGDGDNVWPYTGRNDKFHFDCSKLDQWQQVFDHAQAKGLYLHFKLQETENDDNRHGKGKNGNVPTSLDGGDLGPERKVYLRELVARFGYANALNWNLGEESTLSPEQQRSMAAYISYIDPYDHLIVIHSYPDQQDKVYTPLLGDQSKLTGASLQNHWHDTHRRTVQWIEASAKAGKPWVVANDEQGSAGTGAPPDPGYQGFSGKAEMNGKTYTLHDIRKHVLWGNLMAGGAGVEYYFGYKLPQNDLICEDWRSRDQSWKYASIALDFFRENDIPFHEMRNRDELVSNRERENTHYCFAKEGEIFLVYLTGKGDDIPRLNLRDEDGMFSLQWFNPRKGKFAGDAIQVEASSRLDLGEPPADPKEDWLVVVRKDRFKGR